MKTPSRTDTLAALRRRRSTAAYSLVEVSIAVAMAAVALLAIVGMLPTGLAGSRRVADNTMAASLASDVLSWYRVTPWGKSPWMPPGATNLGVAADSAVLVRSAYFDAMGNLPTNPDTTPNTFYGGNYFKVDWRIASHPSFNQLANCDVVRVQVIWPLRGNPAINPAPNATTQSWVSVYTRY